MTFEPETIEFEKLFNLAKKEVLPRMRLHQLLSEFDVLVKEKKRLMIYHEDDEPTWRHRAEALESDLTDYKQEAEHYTQVAVALEDALANEQADHRDTSHTGREMEARITALEAFLVGIKCDHWTHYTNVWGEPNIWHQAPLGRICEECSGEGTALAVFKRKESKQ